MDNIIKNIGEKIQLQNGEHKRIFVIIDANDSSNERWYKQGSSAICFDAMYADELGLNHYGKLKKFYLADESLDFETEAKSYISSYISLHKIVSDNKELSKIYAFVPEFEIYYDDDQCPYIWTNNVPMRTFEEICNQILVSDYRTEDALNEIVSTLKSLSDCIRILHENNLIHGDINPTNFGFYMRDNKILPDSVSLFDLNTLHYDWQRPKWYTPPYYDENTVDFKRPNLADIRAIGVTLCKALGLSDEKIEDIKNARKMFLSNRKTRSAVEDIVFKADLFDFKGIPSDQRIKDQLVKVVMETVAQNPLKILVGSCTKLRDELQLLETLLLPYCTRDELGRGLGIAIVNKALERKDKIHEVFQYLLYERPLYLYENSSDTFNVLLIGFGLDSQNFLDVCLETAQSMDKKIEIDVWGTNRIKSEKEYYLKERPALSQFFLIDGYEDEITGVSYGSVRFHMQKNGDIEEQIKDIIGETNAVDYIYIAAGNDSDNSEMAETFYELLRNKNVSINSQCEHQTKDREGIHYVCAEGDITENSDYNDIERMSFNTHLIWSGSLNADLERKKKSYLADYYHASCLSNVLSIKYKLHYLGIEMSDGTYKAAQAFKNLKASDKRKMIAAEHRRWVTEKLCDGWVCMKVEDSLPYNDTKDIDGKRHICILRSREEEGLIDKWRNHSTWDNADRDSLSELDELDGMSVRLHQTYRQYALSLSVDDLISANSIDSISEELSGFENAQRIFLEWYESVVYLLNEFVKHENENGREEWSISEYEMLYLRLIEELDRIGDELLKESAKNRIRLIHNEFMPISRALKYHDYKKNDKDLINNIPFILTYTEDITMVVPMDYSILACAWEDVRPTELFSYVAASTVINPKRLYLPYVVDKKESNDVIKLISQKLQAIRDYVIRKGLRTQVDFIRLEKKTGLRNIIKINEDEKLEGWLLIEENGTDIITYEDKDQVSSYFDKYTFDMINISFGHTSSAEWLNNIQRNVCITVRDVAGFLGRTAIIKEQPSFRRIDNRILFGIYNSDRAAWREVCGLLKTSENKNRYIVRFNKPVDNDSEAERHIYFMPYTCYKSVCHILRLLKDERIIGEESFAYRYSVDACKVMIFENGGYEPDLQKLFTRQDLLTAAHKYSVSDSKGKLALCCDGLTVEEIKFDFQENDKSNKMLSLLGSLQKAGFIQLKVKKKSFDITYGSWQIKELFMEQGNFLEIYTFYKTKELNTFDDVVTGVEFHRSGNKNSENEIDCFATKGFQTVIVECKARALKKDAKSKEELREIKMELRNKVRKYGINGSGLLILDSEIGIPDVEDFEEVTVCSRIKEITNIGQVVGRQIRKL